MRLESQGTRGFRHQTERALRHRMDYYERNGKVAGRIGGNGHSGLWMGLHNDYH